ncbi:hypothetical protein [Pseudomonas baetica]|uniref:hypothetical protein n=1 Tax=Pseudomonas baetica TaxID=674054 RepID=UPI0024059787|nr:hypothetical protein [Pseudomonas baetica]MDF9778232.1 hypothetical protein [Pseudomonas baetica]
MGNRFVLQNSRSGDVFEWPLSAGHGLQSLLIKPDAIGAQLECNSAPDDQTTTAHAKKPSCASTQEGFFVCG